MDNIVCGWISDVLYNNRIVGWLLDPSSTSPRDAVVEINGFAIDVLCNEKRHNPKNYKTHINNGFSVLIDEKVYAHLNSKNIIKLIDKSTNSEIAKSVIKIDLDSLKKQIFNDDSIFGEVKTESDSGVLEKKKVIGKLNSKFNNLKISGWLASTDADAKEPRKALLKFPNGMSFTVKTNKFRKDLVSKGINGNSGFVFDIPLDLIAQLPETFEVSLWDKKLNKLIDKVKYSNQPVFTPRNFDEYLKYSMVMPIAYAPFSENYKRCFAFMENVAARLANHNSSTLVSVIMPVYNREKVVRESIMSVLAQTYQNFELIIVDDGSTDNTVSVIESIKDNRIVLLKNRKNKGCSYSRNLAVSKSKGEYIFYLDSDNTWDNRYLKVMVGAFETLPKASALYCGQYLFKKNSDQCYAVRFASFNKSLLENRNYIDMNCFGHTRKSYDAIGGFDASLRRLVDYDLILRLANAFEIYSVPVILSNYYYDKADNTITSTEILHNLQSEKYQSFNLNKKPEEELKVSAVIPNHETIDDLEECINSLISAGCSEIIVVDNNSSEDCIRRLEILEKNKKIKLIKNNCNYGFTYAVNQGMHLADVNNDILLVNNDSVYTGNSIYAMKKAAYSLDNVGLIVPRQVLYEDNESITIHVPYANKKNKCDVNLSIRHFNIDSVPLFSNGKNVKLNFAPFFSVYIRRDIYSLVGDLDAEHGRHYRSDRIYCDVIRHLWRLNIFYVEDSVVYHKLQKSTAQLKSNKDEYEKIFVKNSWTSEEMEQEAFTKKHWEF
ncbi:Glycosyltransferase involved in cell wall bisynthesis [Ruminobacter amylophilus]|uniref:Glycosyltransferase involved in cell wall bisynthesis n=1 Tax=Ruminobacter amylophilus TaxID=867 RepID=A0A662ZK85_9GAMM|nr:glycosyltransferase [Ruminobacter amylophilus]SFP33990.1 Glycosyltransferase involved in cell wall bisynthesis [Ruminobacter amylophilus]